MTEIRNGTSEFDFPEDNELHISDVAFIDLNADHNDESALLTRARIGDRVYSSVSIFAISPMHPSYAYLVGIIPDQIGAPEESGEIQSMTVNGTKIIVKRMMGR